jgi:hypothetical protein
MPVGSIFPEFSHEQASLWGKHPICVRHRIHEHELFRDEELAALISGYPRSNYDLLQMAPQGTGHLALWREGDLGHASGADVLAAIARGRLWLNLRRVHEADVRYATLLDEIFAELRRYMPRFDTFKHNLGILISSANAQVYYHADLPGQSLYQIRGEKRVMVYPNSAPFLPEDQVEGIVLGLTEAEIAYEQWFDGYAKVFHLQPGEMLHWPLNAPHRVENFDCLNISITTEHWTSDIRALYAARYANGLLRRGLGVATDRPPATFGLRFWARAGLAGAVKASGLMRARAHRKRIEWRIDAEVPNGVRDITPFVL